MRDADPFREFISTHEDQCTLGVRLCADCRLRRDLEAVSAITIARSEYDLITEWIDHHRDTCVYCGDIATHRDHLVPRPWTGPGARRFVPTVPACSDCNVRINDAAVFTIAGRADIVAASLRRKWKRELTIADRDDSEFNEYSGMMRVGLMSAQHRRQHLRRRLLVLDHHGAPFAADSLLIAA